LVGLFHRRDVGDGRSERLRAVGDRVDSLVLGRAFGEVGIFFYEFSDRFSPKFVYELKLFLPRKSFFKRFVDFLRLSWRWYGFRFCRRE
jgi:hypothetical protein